MKIIELEILNFRKFENIKVGKLSEISQIFGMNDSGKTTVLNAIRKILDPTERNKDLVRADSYENNGKDIQIKVTLDVGIFDADSNISRINAFELDIDNIIVIEMNAKFDYVEQIYALDWKINDKSINCNRKLPTDDFIEILYIEPQYDIEKSFTNLKKKQRQFYKDNDKSYSRDDIVTGLKNLNQVIIKNEDVKMLQNLISEELIGNNILGKTNIKISSNFDILNPLSDLVISQYFGSNEVTGSGDGRQKIIAMKLLLAAAKLFIDQKSLIVLIEEPESHLFISNQMQFLSDIETDNESFGQIIYTTHSPYILKRNVEYSLIKLQAFNEKENPESGVRCVSFKNNLGYLNSISINQMFFYDKVLLVEGHSEELFYDFCSLYIEDFRNQMNDKNIGIFNVKGINFAPYVKKIRKLGIEVVVKTDNDFHKVSKKNELCYFGYLRAIKFIEDVDKYNAEVDAKLSGKYRIRLDEDKVITPEEKLVIDISNEKDLTKKRIDEIFKEEFEEDMVIMRDILINQNIILSSHNKGFEEDLGLYLKLSDKDKNDLLKKLKEAKHKNLYEVLYENKKLIIDQYKSQSGSDLDNLFGFVK